MRLVKGTTLFVCILWLCISGPERSCADPATIPFQAGEQLNFAVYWSFVPAGEAILEILPNENKGGVNCFHFRATARTNDYVDVFYMVRDRIDSYTDDTMSRAVLFQKRQEGRHKRDAVVDFDWQKNEAYYSNFGEKSAPVSIWPGTFDPLSIFYAFRVQELEEGKEIRCPVTDGKKALMARARVVRREKIRCGGKEYETFLVEPEMKDVAGVFEKAAKATLQIWVTADHDRIPVKIKSAVKVGSFVAELTSWKKGGTDRDQRSAVRDQQGQKGSD
jgi:hypothetical protein